MIIAMVLAGVAVLVAVVLLAMGKGGELAEVHPDHPPLALPDYRPLAGTDAALLKLPRGLWGYNVDITDEALHRLAFALTERDTMIATLEHRIAELREDLAAAGGSTRPAGPGPAPAPAPAPAAEPQGRDHDAAAEPHGAGHENGTDTWAPIDAPYHAGPESRDQTVWTPRSAYQPSTPAAPAPEPAPAPASPYERFSGWWEQGDARRDARAEREEEILDGGAPAEDPAGDEARHKARDEVREEVRDEDRDDRAWLDTGPGDDGIAGRTPRNPR